MFWGLIMEPQKRYSQTVKNSFHVSMAALDLCSCTDEPVQVMCGFENRKYLLCTLQKDGIFQCPLDLNFDVGDEVSFVTNGASHVHLTGFLNDEPMFGDEEAEDEEEEDLVEEETEAPLAVLGNISKSNIVGGKRQKRISSGDLLPAAKKSKTMKMLAEVNSQDEDDSDDSDVNLSDIMEDEDDDETTFLEEDDGDDDDESDQEEEDDDEDEAEDEEEEDSDLEDEDEVSSLSDQVTEEEKPKMNGISKKNKKITPDTTQDKKQKNQTPFKTKGDKKKEEKTPKSDKGAKTPVKSPKSQDGSSPQKKTIEGGLIIEDIRLGNGPVAKTGKMVQVFYEGRFKNNNKLFDSASKGNGFKFRLGKHEVIKGWDVGVAGMKVGGKRRIICPPNMAYGHKGSPPTIPPNSTLVFDVELKNIN